MRSEATLAELAEILRDWADTFGVGPPSLKTLANYARPSQRARTGFPDEVGVTTTPERHFTPIRVYDVTEVLLWWLDRVAGQLAGTRKDSALVKRRA